MSTSDLNELENRNIDSNLPELPRVPPSIEEMHPLLMSVNQSLAGITTEQHNIRVQMEEMSAERTTLPGFERLLAVRDPNQGQGSRSHVLNPPSNL